ncbi:hypothetical protein CLV28_0277 [Sediminihabitans luteus]|uniref:Tetratricopeptide repeat protein n=1 Tax=Sediminihabitans luteus TaxID=1138585 RepID=A0A2M9CZ01_9CELL|nr:hypothetical protein [Sediminihabitans luteus]PJJ77065.1 hypothetical protein CLV28_0277 [Sediminihabitans luteus]GIJ00416.1 hypothetical protein Slu03_27930 [Sediminihabitans luteus]
MNGRTTRDASLPAPDQPRDDLTLPRRTPPTTLDLARAVDHARILRAAGDPGGAARVLDRAFDAEGPRRLVSERQRFRALVLRADLALQLQDGASAARFLDGADALPLVADALAALDGDVHLAEELRERLDVL